MPPPNTTLRAGQGTAGAGVPPDDGGDHVEEFGRYRDHLLPVGLGAVFPPE